MSRTKKGSKGPGWEPWSNLQERQKQKADYTDPTEFVGSRNSNLSYCAVAEEFLKAYTGRGSMRMEWLAAFLKSAGVNTVEDVGTHCWNADCEWDL